MVHQGMESKYDADSHSSAARCCADVSRRYAVGRDTKAAAFERWHEPDDARVSSPDSQGRETRRPASPATDQVRAGHQRKDREGARPRNPADIARARRRGDRMNSLHVRNGSMLLKKWLAIVDES